MHVRPLFTAAALLALGAQSLEAQQAQRYIPVLGATVGAMSIEPSSADRSQVGDRSFGLQLDAGVLMKRRRGCRACPPCNRRTGRCCDG
jgi:hypothetical protein